MNGEGERRRQDARLIVISHRAGPETALPFFISLVLPPLSQSGQCSLLKLQSFNADYADRNMIKALSAFIRVTSSFISGKKSFYSKRQLTIWPACISFSSTGFLDFAARLT